MKVLAIDPGYGRCGIAVVERDGKDRLLYSACIETSPKLTFTERLGVVGSEIERLIDTFVPDMLALEELYFTNNAKTAIHVAEVRGAIIYIASKRNIPLVEHNPLAIKVALTGYGRATKEQVTKMVGLLIVLPEKKMLDDEFDAIALGLTALASLPLKNKASAQQKPARMPVADQ